MILLTPQSELRRELCDVDARLSVLAQQTERAMRLRESIVAALCDHEGCHDTRPTAVR